MEALVYVSNRPEGNIPAEGYIETIIDGLLAAGYGKDDISYCYSYLENDVSVSEQINEAETSNLKNFPSDASLPCLHMACLNLLRSATQEFKGLSKRHKPIL